PRKKMKIAILAFAHATFRRERLFSECAVNAHTRRLSIDGADFCSGLLQSKFEQPLGVQLAASDFAEIKDPFDPLAIGNIGIAATDGQPVVQPAPPLPI